MHHGDGLLEAARAELRDAAGCRPPPVWRALAAMALAPTDAGGAAGHLGAADAPWERFGALRATALLRLHRTSPGGAEALLAATYPVIVESRRPPAVASGLASGDVAAGGVCVRADRDLAEMAVLLGRNPEPFEAWAQAGAAAVDASLWAEAAGTYTSGGSPDPLRGCAALFGSIPDRARAERVVGALRDGAAVPGRLARDRIPDHLLVSFLAWEGLALYGFTDDAADLLERTTPVLARGLAGDDALVRHSAAVTAILTLGG